MGDKGWCLSHMLERKSKCSEGGEERCACIALAAFRRRQDSYRRIYLRDIHTSYSIPLNKIREPTEPRNGLVLGDMIWIHVLWPFYSRRSLISPLLLNNLEWTDVWIKARWWASLRVPTLKPLLFLASKTTKKRRFDIIPAKRNKSIVMPCVSCHIISSTRSWEIGCISFYCRSFITIIPPACGVMVLVI